MALRVKVFCAEEQSILNQYCSDDDDPSTWTADNDFEQSILYPYCSDDDDRSIPWTGTADNDFDTLP